jgi:5-methyltetrahydrofolate--homocysteine methyltransferase
MSMRNIIEKILAFDDSGTIREIQANINCGADARDILTNGLIAAMDEVGRLYAQGTFFVPEMLMAGQAMKAGLSALRPYLENAEIPSQGCIVIGTVQGDQHDIGKNLVAMMLECAGFRVIDLGRDVDPDRFVQAARKNRADVVAMSALISSTLRSMKTTVSRVKSQDKAIKTLVGGAPVTQAFAGRIGADGYSPDAIGAVEVVRRLIGMREGLLNPKKQ